MTAIVGLPPAVGIPADRLFPHKIAQDFLMVHNNNE